MSGTATPTENRIANEVYGSVSNGSEWYLTITSGTDIENPKLIAWLSKWGELQVEEEGEAPPDDLTGYTVTVPAGWSAEIGYGIFTLDFEVDLFVSGTYYGTIPCIYSLGNLRMGYDADGYLADNVLSFRSTISDHSANFQNFTPDPSTPFSFSIRVTGGDDTDDPSLIQWFVDNKATFEKTGGEEEPPEEIVIIPAGTYRFKDVLTPLPFEILNRGYGSGNHDWLLSEYGFDVSPLPFLLKEGDVEATVTISRFSISYLFGDVYVDDKPTVFYDYMVIKAELMGEQATAGFDSFRFAGLQFTIPEDTEAHSITCTWFTENTEPYSEEPTPTSQGEIYYKGNLVATLVEGETIVLHTKDFKFLGDIVIKNVGEVENVVQSSNFVLADGSTFITSDGNIFNIKEN